MLPGVRYQYLLVAHDGDGVSGEYLSQIVMIGGPVDTQLFLPVIAR